jgi:hypothetical protein
MHVSPSRGAWKVIFAAVIDFPVTESVPSSMRSKKSGIDPGDFVSFALRLATTSATYFFITSDDSLYLRAVFR